MNLRKTSARVISQMVREEGCTEFVQYLNPARGKQYKKKRVTNDGHRSQRRNIEDLRNSNGRHRQDQRRARANAQPRNERRVSGMRLPAILHSAETLANRNNGGGQRHETEFQPAGPSGEGRTRRARLNKTVILEPKPSFRKPPDDQQNRQSAIDHGTIGPGATSVIDVDSIHDRGSNSNAGDDSLDQIEIEDSVHHDQPRLGATSVIDEDGIQGGGYNNAGADDESIDYDYQMENGPIIDHEEIVATSVNGDANSGSNARPNNDDSSDAKSDCSWDTVRLLSNYLILYVFLIFL